LRLTLPRRLPVYAVLMPPGESDQTYPASMRAAAAAGLLVIGALAFILLDVMSGGKLAGALSGGCGCEEDKAGDGA
jgi:hypothetical protein